MIQRVRRKERGNGEGRGKKESYIKMKQILLAEAKKIFF